MTIVMMKSFADLSVSELPIIPSLQEKWEGEFARGWNENVVDVKFCRTDNFERTPFI